jgi:hypothetical protein
VGHEAHRHAGGEERGAREHDGEVGRRAQPREGLPLLEPRVRRGSRAARASSVREERACASGRGAHTFIGAGGGCSVRTILGIAIQDSVESVLVRSMLLFQASSTSRSDLNPTRNSNIEWWEFES